MKVYRLLPVFAAGIALSACATPWQVAEVQDAKTLTATAGTPFTKALTEAYKAQAAYETDVEHEWQDAVFYVRKAQRAAGGEVVAPENPGDWKIASAATVTELTNARGRLMSYFDQGARERVPEIAAKAQGNYDCWVEEESEGDTDNTCKKAFLAAEPDLKAPMAPAPVAHKPTVIKTFVVLFDFGSSKLTAKAKNTLHEVAVAQGELKPTAIYVSGYTDTVGNNAFNMKLSDHRAHRVSSALETMGVQTTTLDVKAYGKEKLAIETKDNVRNAENRRVTITFEK